MHVSSGVVVVSHGRGPYCCHCIVVCGGGGVVWQRPIDAAAAAGCGDVVVVLPFVGGDHCS